MLRDPSKDRETPGAEIGRLLLSLLPERDPNKPSIRDVLALTEEKRRLLTCIIEWMTSCALASKDGPYTLVGVYMNNIYVLIELHKRVNSATTMAELAKIGEELAEFKKQHPELGE